MNQVLALEWPFSELEIERLGWVLVHSFWQFAAVALLAGLTVRAMRKCSATTRYGVLVVAMAVSVAAPMATWMLVEINPWPDPLANQVAILQPGPSEAVASAADNGRSKEKMVSPGDSELEASIPDNEAALLLQPVGPFSSLVKTQAAQSWSERAYAVFRPWLAWIVFVWGLGVALCSARPLLGWHTLRRLRRFGSSSVSPEVAAAMARVSSQLGLRRVVRVFQSSLAQVPAVVGYLRPMILLPVSLVTSVPASQLEAILTHELAHVRRHDFVVNLLQTLVETLFFYHPAL